MHLNFAVHMLNERGKEEARKLAAQFDGLQTYVTGLGGDSRCQSIAATKLEEACFYAKKALATNPDMQDPNA